MGQYKKHLYGTTVYGNFPYFVGEYTTSKIDAEEPFSGRISFEMETVLPKYFYNMNSEDIQLTGEWKNKEDYKETFDNNATFTFIGSGDNIELLLKKQNKGIQEIKVSIYGINNEFLSSEVINTYDLLDSSGFITYKRTGFFNQFILKTEVLSGIEHGFGLKGINVSTTNVELHLRASRDGETWTSLNIPQDTKELNEENQKVKIRGISTVSYLDVRYVQAYLMLLSSEEYTAPIVEKIIITSGDMTTRTKDGIWNAIVDMDKVAGIKSNELGKTVGFDKATKIKWNEEVPENTSLTVRTASSYEGVLFGPISAPYKKDKKRLRLKEGIINSSIVIGPINPINKKMMNGKNVKENWNVQKWIEWIDESYMPKDEVNVKTTYFITKTKENIQNKENQLMNPVVNPMNKNKDKVSNVLPFSPQSFYLTIKMERLKNKGTPVVDLIKLYSLINYDEEVEKNNYEVSAVDSQNTGVKLLEKISDTLFNLPVSSGENAFNKNSIELSEIEYSIEDNTNRPNDVLIYLKSEEDVLNKTRKTKDVNNTIYSKVFSSENNQQGVIKHYQYSGGSVQYLRPREEEMSSLFTPTVSDTNKKYLYYISSGWPQEVHTTKSNDTLEDIAILNGITVEEIKTEMSKKGLEINYLEDGKLQPNKLIYLPNKSINRNAAVKFKNNTQYTKKSSHNARIDKLSDLTSENIVITIPNSPEFNYSEWISEEKIYDGVINYGDIRSIYRRTQTNAGSTTDVERDYLVEKNDTWESISTKFNLNVEDLKKKNKEQLVEGESIVIPSNIVLPYIEPGVEFEDSNPFEISIIDNSVFKKDGTPIDKEFIPVIKDGENDSISVEYKTSTPVTVSIVRGAVLNDMDALLHKDVIEILNVQKENGMSFIKYNEISKTGDYKLNKDYIDWSPAMGTSREPEKDEVYFVTYTYKEVDVAHVQLDTTYVEETGVDILWRSPEIKVIDGYCSPQNDFLVPLPTKETFRNYNEKNIVSYDYIIEDNDLWVDTFVEERDGTDYLRATLRDRNPKDNWHPLITPGFYYLKEQEHYLFSETIETKLEEKEIPIAKNVGYLKTSKDMGIHLEPESSNLVLNSSLKNKEWKTSFKLNFKEEL